MTQLFTCTCHLLDHDTCYYVHNNNYLLVTTCVLLNVESDEAHSDRSSGHESGASDGE